MELGIDKLAEKVVIAPTEPVRIMSGGVYLLKVLEGRPVKRGQRIGVKVGSKELIFEVADTIPDGVVVVDKNTEIDLLEEPYEEIIKKNPKALFKYWIDKNIVIYLKEDHSITGILKGFDDKFNFLLAKATLFKSGKIKVRDFENTVVNGVNVLNVSLAKVE